MSDPVLVAVRRMLKAGAPCVCGQPVTQARGKRSRSTGVWVEVRLSCGACTTFLPLVVRIVSGRGLRLEDHERHVWADVVMPNAAEQRAAASLVRRSRPAPPPPPRR